MAAQCPDQRWPRNTPKTTTGTQGGVICCIQSLDKGAID